MQRLSDLDTNSKEISILLNSIEYIINRLPADLQLEVIAL